MSEELIAAILMSRVAALNATVEGMKIENAERMANGSAPAYCENHFQQAIFDAKLRDDIVEHFAVTGNL